MPAVATSPTEVITVARSQIGVHEGRSNKHWNNRQKYSKAVPGLEWSNGQPWCATFVSWCALEGSAGSLYPKTASCDTAGAWFKKDDRWSEFPAIGAQVFYGSTKDLNHTGLVVDFDDDTITTVEGNTNDNGSREGDGVYLKVRDRRGGPVVGYGYPRFADGIVSADPEFAVQAPVLTARTLATAVVTPTETRGEMVDAAIDSLEVAIKRARGSARRDKLEEAQKILLGIRKL